MISFSMLVVAFSMGFLGSSHCVAMCGGIVSALTCGATKTASSLSKLLSFQLCHNLGRLTSYALMGAIFGICGDSLQQLLGINHLFLLRDLAAVFIIILGLYITGWWRGLVYLERLGQKVWQPISRFATKFFPIVTAQQALLMGLLWGFLPCGLVYSALVLALTSGSGLNGSLMMLSFGLGTLPALLITGTTLISGHQFLQKPVFRLLAGVTLIAWGGVSMVIIHSGHLQHCAHHLQGTHS